MTFKEQLNELNLDEERLNTLISALNSEYTEKAEYEKISERLKAAKTECERLSDNLNAAQSEYKRKAGFLKQAAEDKSERLKGIYELKLKSSLIDIALSEFGAKNTEIVRRLIDEEKTELKDGKLTGLVPQLNELKKKAPFLFEQTLMYLTGYRPEPSSDLLPSINPSDMTYSQALAYLDE